eukprot:4768614-Prymnesium_polylepis.1
MAPTESSQPLARLLPTALAALAGVSIPNMSLPLPTKAVPFEPYTPTFGKLRCDAMDKSAKELTATYPGGTAEQFPVIVYTHGAGPPYGQFLGELHKALASWGVVVLGVDSCMNAATDPAFGFSSVACAADPPTPSKTDPCTDCFTGRPSNAPSA